MHYTNVGECDCPNATAYAHGHHSTASYGTTTSLHYWSNGVFYYHHCYPLLLGLPVDSPLHCCWSHLGYNSE